MNANVCRSFVQEQTFVVLELKNRNLAMVELGTELPWLCVCARARTRVYQPFLGWRLTEPR